jgi:hypothetical protein
LRSTGAVYGQRHALAENKMLGYNEDTVKNGLVKNWTVRGTVHVFNEEDLPLFIHCNNGADHLKTTRKGKACF